MTIYDFRELRGTGFATGIAVRPPAHPGWCFVGLTINSFICIVPPLVLWSSIWLRPACRLPLRQPLRDQYSGCRPDRTLTAFCHVARGQVRRPAAARWAGGAPLRTGCCQPGLKCANEARAIPAVITEIFIGRVERFSKNSPPALPITPGFTGPKPTGKCRLIDRPCAAAFAAAQSPVERAA